MVSYDDVLGPEREIIAVSENTVRAEVTSDLDGVENPTNGSPGFRDKGNEERYTRTVAEDIAVGSSVGDAVVARDPNDDTLTYDLDVDLLDAGSTVDGAGEPDGVDDGDIEFFSIDPASGMVTVKKGLNYEDHADGYTIFIRAVDPSGETDHVQVTIKVTDANDAPDIMGSSEINADGEPIDENDAVRAMMPDAPSELRVKEKVGNDYDGMPGMPLRSLPGDMNVFTASDEDARHQTFWSIKGDDVDDFQLTSSSPDPISGLRGPGEPIALKFRSDPDFENPTDDNLDSVYKVTLVARDRFTGGLMDERPLTIFVTNEQESGKVVLDEDQPLIGQPITASVDDPDNGVAIVTWRWERASSTADDAVWEVIPGATTDTYTPKSDNKGTDDRDEDDNGYYLRAIATYTDIMSNPDNSVTVLVDERTQKIAADGAVTANAAPEARNPEAEGGADKVYRRSQVSTNAVRVKPGLPSEEDAPEFASATFDRVVDENAETGASVGDPIHAVPEYDEDGKIKTFFRYNLDATITGDDDYFTLASTTGQIKVGEVPFPNPIPAGVIPTCDHDTTNDIPACPPMTDPESGPREW